jgi:hypothetical protein
MWTIGIKNYIFHNLYVAILQAKKSTIRKATEILDVKSGEACELISGYNISAYSPQADVSYP